MTSIAVLLIGKFVLYFAVCLAAPRLLLVAPQERSVFALAWAAVRLGLGLLAAYPIAALWSVLERTGMPDALIYALVLLCVRAVLWWLVAALICQRHQPNARPRIAGWVLLGVSASFAIDAVAWLSGANFKFFC